MLSLALAVRALGPALQVRTLVVTLFLLCSQILLFDRVGAAYSDYTAMMFITAAVAVYLHRQASSGLRHEWHALAIGALTVAAFRSKEIAVVLAWLLLLFLWENGRLDLRRFLRKLGWWTAGAAAAWLFLMTLDGWLLGDFWFSVRSESLTAVRRFTFAPEPQAVPSPPRARAASAFPKALTIMILSSRSP